MAKFMIKASELKNVCKAVNDRKLAELKKEIIEILKKQDEKEFKKAIDYLESQELYFTHLEKSFSGKWIEKAGYGIGTVRVWKGKKYKKIAPNKWVRVFDKEGRGTNIAIGKLIARVQKIDNVEDLMAFVMQNKQRFVDENGIDLPVLDKLRAAVDARNSGAMGSKEHTERETIAYNQAKNGLKKEKERLKEYEEQGADDSELNKIKENIKEYEEKISRIEKERGDRNSSKKKTDSKDDLQAALKEVEDAIDNAGDYDDIEELENERQKILKKLGKNEKPSEKKTVDYSKMSEDELNDLNKKLRQAVKEKDYGEADEEIEQINEISKQKMINSFKTREKHTLQHVEDIEQKKKMITDSKAIVEKDLARKEKQRAKESSIAKKNQMADEIDELKYKKAAFEQLEKELDESEGEKHQNRSDAMKGNKNAYKGGPKDVAKYIFSKTNDMKKRNSMLLEAFNERYGTKEEGSGENNNRYAMMAVSELYTKVKQAKPHSDEWYNAINNYDEAAEMYRMVIGDDGIEHYNKEVESIRMKPNYSKEKLPESSKETPMPNPSTGVYAPSESTNLETKKAIAENKSIGENEVQMPYSKELENEIKTLKNNVSDDPTRQFMGHVYYDDGVLVATDGRRLKIVKVGKLDGIENGSYVDINISKDGINLKKREGMEDVMFPNYRGVIPDNLTQKVTLNNKVIKDKIKEMKKDGAIDRKLNLIQLEFKNGKVYLDDTEIGEAKDINLKYNGDDTNYVNVNAEYLSDALSGNTSTLMLSKDARKSMAISTESTSNIVMPMNQEGKVDYSESRKAKKERDDFESEQKKKHQDAMNSIVDTQKESMTDAWVQNLINRVNNKEMDNHKAIIEHSYNALKEAEKMIDKPTKKWTSSLTNNKYGFSLLAATRKNPEFKTALENMANEYGLIKKSLFDDFVIDNFIEEDIDELEEEQEEESLFNDYSAEQPELFNSTEFQVREALNRRFNCL